MECMASIDNPSPSAIQVQRGLSVCVFAIWPVAASTVAACYSKDYGQTVVLLRCHYTAARSVVVFFGRYHCGGNGSGEYQCVILY